MSYSAGSLELNLIGYSSGAISSIQQTVKSLNSLSRALSKINETQFVLAGQKIEHIFTKIASATNSINTTNITALATTAKSLSALTKISKLETVDFNKIGAGFQNLTVAITPFIEKVQTAEASLTALYGVLSKASGKKMQNILGEGTATTTSKKGGAFSFLNVARWGATIYMARRLGRVVADIAQAGADYTETLNLWETAMGTNVTLATEFVNKMNEAYGISEKTLMNAQATFKNMLGGLGNISDEMAYALSEGVTQMAVDYASLYNQTFEQAFTKFQAALAGQVRPIRSVSGFDITENTLFQLYQSLGGTKTMRQLTRTEKQLLSILAIFQQMTATGAVGDLNKTMESFANQSRVMAESWQQVKSYAGIALTYLIQESGLLTFVNATLIFLGDILKSVAESMGAIQHFADPFETVTEGALTADEALSKVNGKLLDFDKFRALNESGVSLDIGLDDKLLIAFANFESILEGAEMQAGKLAKRFKEISGLFDETGAFNLERWKEILSGALLILIDISIVLGIVFGKKAISKIGLFATNFIKNFQEMRLQAALADTTLQKLQLSFSTLLGGVMALSMGILSLAMSWDTMKGWERFITIFVSLAAAIGAAAAAFYAFKQNWFMAIGVGAMVAGTGLTIGSQLSSITNFKNGGLPDKGTLFRAGEAGAEIVYNTPSGQSGVANIKQIEQAMYNALTRASNTNGGTTVVEIDGQRVFTVVKEKAKSNGYAFSKV